MSHYLDMLSEFAPLFLLLFASVLFSVLHFFPTIWVIHPKFCSATLVFHSTPSFLGHLFIFSWEHNELPKPALIELNWNELASSIRNQFMVESCSVYTICKSLKSLCIWYVFHPLSFYSFVVSLCILFPDSPCASLQLSDYCSSERMLFYTASLILIYSLRWLAVSTKSFEGELLLLSCFCNTCTSKLLI